MQVLYIIADFLAVAALFILVFGLTRRDRQVLLSAKRKLVFKGVAREYLVYEPKAPAKVNKIILSFHGFGDSARRNAYYTALHNCVDGHTAVIYPEATSANRKGLIKGWNAGFCCGSGWVNKTDDSGFILDLIQKLQIQYAVKSSETFLAGFSNGAMFAQKVATDHPGSIGGIVSVAGTIGTSEYQLKPKKPVPILTMHGKQDRQVPYRGGTGLISGFNWQSFEATTRAWKAANKNKKPLEVVVNELAGHSWPGWRLWQLNRRQPRASRQAVQFIASL